MPQIRQHSLPSIGKYWKNDLLAGFQVFLIALPLCLGISLASGFPAISGVFTAIVGGILATFIGNSALTIKGPAAGMIVIVLGCMIDFGYSNGQSLALDFEAYRMTLAVGCVSGILQIFLGLFKGGKVSELFPTSVVAGMLAAIGLIIVAKQFPVMLGVDSVGDPLELLATIPQQLTNLNPKIAAIGLSSLILLAVVSYSKYSVMKTVPGPLMAMVVAVPMGIFFNLSEGHTYEFAGGTFDVGKQYLVDVPLDLWSVITLPNFEALKNPTAWKWILIFMLVGSVESLLSTRAVDTQDPHKRKTDMDRDLISIGVANTFAAIIGGLPMISEIVRSKANIDNGAKTKYANCFHGIFLLLFVAFAPGILKLIPLAALAAMLVFTGLRLASPMTFIHFYRVSKGQFLVFASTVFGVVAIDLLVGVGIGVLVELALQLSKGASPASYFYKKYRIENRKDKIRITPEQDTVFANWHSLKTKIEEVGIEAGRDVEIDFSEATVVDHTTAMKLEEIKEDFKHQRLALNIVGINPKVQQKALHLRSSH